MNPSSRWLLGGLVLLAALAAVWLAPLDGTVIVQTGAATTPPTYPQIAVESAGPDGLAMITVTDTQSWAHVKLTVDGVAATFLDWEEITPGTLWRWRWTAALPEDGAALAFYHDCATGCRLRGMLELGTSKAQAPAGLPTKLCVVFADPARNWHERQGWVVDMTYMTLADDEVDPYWGVDALAARVATAERQGLRVLVRVEYDRNQTLPPVGDYLALTAYLNYVRRLARDARLQTVYGYVIGSGMNADDANQQAPNTPLNPAWVARVINGAGEPPTHVDNVIAVVRAEHPSVRILVGPVRPWIDDQNPSPAFALDAPWLNYLNALAAALDAGIREKATAGIGWGTPDGFALHAPGRPDALELDTIAPSQEPYQEMARSAWNGAQAGFLVYRDWTAVIDSYASLHGLPVYITATNTFAPDGIGDSPGEPPAQNYPHGWLTSAYAVINQDPRVQSLCWFLDLVPGDNRWDAFSLARGQGRLIFAAEELDALLQRSAAQIGTPIDAAPNDTMPEDDANE